MARVTALHVNGASMRIDADPARSLLSVLRDDLHLTGAKYGCGEGQCGACTVLVDGLPTRSCTAKVGSIAEKEVTTIEGIERRGQLHPLQAAFQEAGAMQCSYCTCGMILSGVALLSQNPNPSRDEIVRFMNGNICRCGVYQRIIAAISKAAQAMKEAGQ
jgi:aerobic-type carbon monoxide dehydrogenase small subunit (CoxS/CutS family)